MSVLPSPIPHPLDYAPWDVPGWIYETLDWVIGVQWPEGDERAVWDVADRWYAVASVLAGPRTDAAEAAAEVRSGYGGVGAVDAAFQAAWRGLAEGDNAPLPVLLAVSTDLGRLVEECGCDIEGAKLEVWIELGILVVELLTVAVVAVLTAGAASPAAGAAVTATRLLIQQICKRLLGQLASKSLKHGLKEAGERAAKEVAKGGVRGFAKRATREGLEEAAEEAGISLATQAYQNSTGRAHGIDLADLSTSAVGGLAGGVVAPVAGLGRHANGRVARVGEHLGREMTGEMFAETAASIATGQGPISAEDAVRAAASGVTGSVTGQVDHALQARVQAQSDALAGASFTGPSLPPDFPVTAAAGVSVQAGVGVAGPPASAALDYATPLLAEPSTYSTADGADLPQPSSSDPSRPSASTTGVPSVVEDGSAVLPSEAVVPAQGGPAAPERPIAADPTLSSAGSAAPVGSAGLVDSAGPAGSAGLVGSDPQLSSVAVDATLQGSPTGQSHTATQGALASGGNAPTVLPSSAGAPAATGTLGPPFTQAAVTSPAPAAPVVPPSVAAPQPFGPVVSPSPVTGPAVGAPNGAFAHGVVAAGRSTVTGPAAQPAPANAPWVLAPAAHPARGRASVRADVAAFGDPPVPARESHDWYAARWTAEAEAAERRRYQRYYESQRAAFENTRRQAEAGRLRLRAAEHDRRAIEYATYARQLHQTGHRQWSDGWQRAANDEARAYAECRDLAEAVLAGARAPEVVDLTDGAFHQANKDLGSLTLGAVETTGRSALTGDDVPPPIDDSRPYGQPGGLRPPLALHQVDVERQMPRERDGTVIRTADPRRGGWFRLLNDGGPRADATRGINCLDCTLSLFETWVHGRPRVSAPRTFDGYLGGDIRRPIRGEAGGPGRVEDVTGGRFQQVLAPPPGQRLNPGQARQVADRAYVNLRDQLLLGGHGSYAFLVTEWASGGSHAWVALNQNGTILYLDPQTGAVRDRPLYPDVIGIDALVLSGDGQPMPLGGLPRGRFSERPDLPNHPPAYDNGSHGDPYINRMYLLLDGPGSADADAPSGAAPSQRPADGSQAPGSVPTEPDPIQALLLSSAGLDQVFAAEVSPGEFASAVDAPTLRRLVPDLDEAAAEDVARLFADARVRDMLDRAEREPPRNEPDLAVSLVRQLVQQPDLVRMILTTPELANSLTARPLTLHHLASHQQAIDVLGEVLDGIAKQEAVGLPAAANRGVDQPEPTPLTDQQRQISASLQLPDDPATQPGFDKRRQADQSYRQQYLDDLYEAAAGAQVELNQLAMSLAQVGDRRVGEPGWRHQPKDRQRAEDKLDKYQGDASKLFDLAAAKVEFRCLDDLYTALTRIREHPDVVIVRGDDRFVSPMDSGYRDVQLVLQMSNGHLAEFRLHLAALDAVAVWEHVLYEVRRDIETLAQVDGRALTLRERTITGGIRRREQQLFWQALLSTFEENA
ncbi:toxin glutamine deamidase domain-containing protein [Micromonospora profundi]|uniref:toxin glutamine deamidase domain-containing protein n=1 Tax=Micromonospora profundi TaxID=1420889 RepID=UPI0033B7BAB3